MKIVQLKNDTEKIIQNVIINYQIQEDDCCTVLKSESIHNATEDITFLEGSFRFQKKEKFFHQHFSQ
jgi:hypothetical protein